MFNWLRGLTISAETRRQERTIAYVDGTLSEKEKVQFAAEMARDAALQAEVAELQQLKATLQAVPRQPVPRNFILDPAAFAKVKPKPAYDVRFYPVLRAATALSALLFIVMATLTLSSGLRQTESLAEFTSAPVPTEIDAVAMIEPVKEKVVEDFSDAASEPIPDAAAAESEIALLPTSEDVGQADVEQPAQDVTVIAESEEAEITADEDVETDADTLANSIAESANSDAVDTASAGAEIEADNSAETTPTPSPAPTLAPRNVIPPSAATGATENGEFRAPPMVEPTIGSVETDQVAGLAPTPTLEAGADSFDDSAANNEGIVEEATPAVRGAERVEVMKIRPKTLLTIALALLFTLLLA
ncbi:MAG TPA: hypothetical protein ENJ56_03615, partial [Anaerolineae bacterium]|nr:hypothetical protein [Anaerolineae bacterium]